MPKVSVIVPNYNHAQYLQPRFDSIFNQSYQDFEVIILDDCSTDNSREIIEKYQNHPKVSHIIYNDRNGGTSYKQWYKGIELSKGELIWIAESDDFSDLRFLETSVKPFKNQNVALVSVGSVIFYSESEINAPELTKNVEYLEGNKFICENMVTGNKIPNVSMVVFRKIKYDQVKNNGYKEFKLSGDYYLWVQLINNNQIANIPDKLNFCRKHETNVTNKYRSLGYDFIEGMKVLDECKKICSYKINRNKIYLKWIDYYKIYKSQFSKGTKIKVLLSIFNKEPILFFFLIYKLFKNNIKTFIKLIKCPKFP